MATLIELERQVAQALGDYRIATATETSSTTTMTDNDTFVESRDFFRGGQLRFLSGANTGQVRRIIGSDTPSWTVTFNPAVGLPVTAGDQAELFNVGGYGGRPGFRLIQLDQAINAAIQNAFPQYREVWQLDLSTPIWTDDNSNEVAIPEEFTHIGNVGIIHANGFIEYLEKTRYPDSTYGYWINHQRRNLIINYGDAVKVGDNGIRIEGYRRPQRLVDGSDSTNCDTEWVVETAKSILTLGLYDQTLMSAGQSFGARADQLRAKMAMITEPNMEQV